MRLQKISYSRFAGEDREWRLDEVEFGPINLIVGKNASGKTKMLNAIEGLAEIVCGELKPDFLSGSFHIQLQHNGDVIIYDLVLKDRKVLRESFSLNDREYLKRREHGVGTIYAEREKKDIDFQSPDTEVAVVARRDLIQHPYLDSLNKWGQNMYFYPFGTHLGRKRHYYDAGNGETSEEINIKDFNQVVSKFIKGEQSFGGDFKNKIISDMEYIGYPLEDISTGQLVSHTVPGPLSEKMFFLRVKEKDLPCVTDQGDMSQGMFRALSIIIQLNFSDMGSHPSGILIDDIGEGLDFERSTALIELLMDRVKKSGIQLIMATNDRFVMNKVPLEYWSVISRKGGCCKLYNYQTHRDKFEEFKFTGLNNFDFFATDFLEGEAP